MKRLMTTLFFVLLCGMGLCFAEGGVTVSGKVTFDAYGSSSVDGYATGTVKLLQNNTAVYSGDVTITNYVSSYSIEGVPAGEYKLSFDGLSESYTVVLIYEEDITVENTNLTKDFKAQTDDTRGIKPFQIKYGEWNADYSYWANTKEIPGAKVTYTKVGDDTPMGSKISNNYGYVYLVAAKDANLKYNVTVQADTYMDTTITDFAFYDGSSFGGRQEVYMREIPLPTVTVSGSVKMNGEVLTTLPGEDMAIGLETVKGKLPTAKVSNGQYTLTDIPVGTATFFIYDPDGSYNYSFKTTTSANFGIKTPADGQVTLTESAEGFTQDIEIERIAVNVTGTIEGIKEAATVRLMKGEDQINDVRSNAVGEYKFQGVKPGTYTVVALLYGYEQKNTPSVTVESLEKGDVTADNIVMEGKEMEFTFENTYFSAQNIYTNKWPLLTGAKIEIWSVDEEGNAKEKLNETTAGDEAAYAAWSLKVTAKMGTTFIIRITHPDIEDYEMTITATQENMNVYPQGIEFKYDGPRVKMVQNFNHEWNAAHDSLILKWAWPAELSDTAYKITNVSLSRKRSDEQYGHTVTYWPQDYSVRYIEFADLPTSCKDTLTDGFRYYYTISIRYEKPYFTNLDSTFEVDLRPAYTLTYAANDAALGTIESETESGSQVKTGDMIELIAVAAEDCRFIAWLNMADQDTLSKRDTTTLLMPDTNFNVQAVFEQYRFTITVAADDAAHGDVEGGKKYELGEEVTVKATPKDGWLFEGWQEDGEIVSTEAVYTFTANKNRNLTATFAAVKHVLSLKVNNAEWGKVEGANEYAAGTEVTITATANPNYRFVAWMDGDTEFSTEAAHTFTMPEKDLTLTAVFAEETANEDLEAARWTVYAENGTLIIKGLNGDRYSVYDLNGRLSGQAVCTGDEIRMDVAPNKLYIVRRISAAGAFGAKKVVVR